jgi:hypothetical protein
MLFMVVESPRDRKLIGERLGRHGRMLPEGVICCASWVDAASRRCFQLGEFDDLHDAAVLGLLRLRRGGFRIATDQEDEEWQPRPAREYY